MKREKSNFGRTQKENQELIAKRIFIMIENAHVTSDQSKNIDKERRKRERERIKQNKFIQDKFDHPVASNG